MKKNIVISIPVSILFFLSHFISAQNVGIGTSTPLEKLHVDGNILMDTAKLNAILLTPNAGVGKLLTSDAIGNAAWENLVIPPLENNSNGNIGYGVWGDCATNGNISEYNPVADEEGSGQDISVGDHFGYSTSISGDFAIVGSYGDDDIAGMNQGSVSFYHFDGNKWIFMEKITDSDGEEYDFFGSSVAISGNFAIVGSPEDNGPAGINQGSVSFYQFDGNSWLLIQKTTDTDGDMNDYFGQSVSISGNYAIIGSLQDNGPAGSNQGSVSVYQFDGTDWVLMEKIFDASGAADDFFGNNVSISGNSFIAGSYFDSDVSGLNQGSASIYQFDGNNWIFVQKLLDATGAIYDNFGTVVSISGDNVLIGAPEDDGSSGQNQGSISFFHFNGSNWTLSQKLYDSGGSAEDYFGNGIAISGQYAIVGSAYDNLGAQSDQGSADIYIRLGNTWERLQYVIDPRGKANDNFGQGVAIDSLTKRFITGVPGYVTDMGKAIFGKVN